MGSGQREHPTNIFFCEGDNVLKIFLFFSESGREKPILLMTKQSPLDLMSSRCIARPSLAYEVYSVVREVQRSNSQDLESKRTVEWRDCFVNCCSQGQEQTVGPDRGDPFGEYHNPESFRAFTRFNCEKIQNSQPLPWTFLNMQCCSGSARGQDASNALQDCLEVVKACRLILVV